MNSSERDVIIKLYESRFEEFGRDIKTVGWGKIEDQILRFDVLFRGIDPKGKRILDVGCGLGDLIPYLDQKTDGDYDYLGIDIASSLIYSARETYGGNSRRQFSEGDVTQLSPESAFDISVLSGALTFKTEDNFAYADSVMRRMFHQSSEVTCLNFMSSYVDFRHDKNFHYEPEAIFSRAKKISSRVNLIHDYPLWEFTVQIFK